MSDEIDPLLDVLNNAVLAAEDTVWRTTAMAQLTVRMGVGQYRKSAIAAGDPEMLFVGVRAGKRADYIFEFEPVDKRPYEAIEMDETKVFSMLAGFEELLVKTMGYPPQVETVDGLTIEQPLSFSKARALFKRDHAKREKVKREAAIAATVSSEAERYRDNPLWGAF